MLRSFLTTRLSADTKYPDCMIDVETSGTNPQFGNIIQLSAVAFNYETEEIGPAFDQCLLPAPNRFWSESTRQWWSEQKQGVLADIVSRARQPEVVIEEFYDWVSLYTPNARFWSRGSFDWFFVASYMEQFGREMPFPYWGARDLRSFQAGLAGAPDEPYIKGITLKGDAHNALYDVALQLKQLFAVKNKEITVAA